MPMFDVKLSIPHVGCFSGNFSCDPINYDFSPDGIWLTTSNPSTWALRRPGAALHELATPRRGRIGRPRPAWDGQPERFLAGNRLLMSSDGVISAHKLNLDGLFFSLTQRP
ncbi:MULTISPECIES: hypothetical protein [unclassified Pseudomonas]|uniref:hypothetical protein n=1 Tax=unclassified Pseudomonas TaxID=196821 RepID=UPI001CBD71E9|nr:MULTISPECIES: hypothetical protein [unclassified Pseudomonas]